MANYQDSRKEGTCGLYGLLCCLEGKLLLSQGTAWHTPKGDPAALVCLLEALRRSHGHENKVNGRRAHFGCTDSSSS